MDPAAGRICKAGRTVSLNNVCDEDNKQFHCHLWISHQMRYSPQFRSFAHYKNANLY